MICQIALLLLWDCLLMIQPYITEYHHMLILLLFSVILMLFSLGSASGWWNLTRPSVRHYGLHLSTSQFRHLTRFIVRHLNWLSPPSTSVWPLTPNWISITTSILSLRKQMTFELSWTVISDPVVRAYTAYNLWWCTRACRYFGHGFL